MGGDSHTGGGGSVVWTVEVQGASETKILRTTRGSHQHTGVDKSGRLGGWFTVSIKPPGRQSAREYLDALKEALTVDAGSNRVYFNLQIEKDPQQVRVSWGQSRNQRGKAARKRPR